MAPLHRLLGLAVLSLSLAACHAPARQDAAQETAPPLFDTFGDLHRDIGTRVPEAQRYFDQGLRLAYGFNHEAAARAFAEAERLDPKCAMCAWGQALVLGPNINLPMSPDLAADATTLALRAQHLSANAKPADQALITALTKRYITPAPTDRAPLDQAYAQAMGEAHQQFPDDDDIAALYAESLMDLTPWAYWNAQGQPTQYTDAIVGTLETVLKRNPRHIGAAHYYIHAVEASNQPERAEPYADRLAALAPGSGHLVHMPAHVYIRVGRYHDATLSNLAASTADKAFLAVCRGSNGAYPLGYVPHNWHFAAMTAALHGSRTLAIEAADQTAQRVDPQQLEAMAFMQQFLVAPLFARVRFGEWDAILAQAEPPSQVAFPRAIWHFARGMAFVRTDKPEQARKELKALQAIAKDPAMEKVVLFDINRADRVLDVAQNMLAGELALSTRQTKAGLDYLRKAVAAEDLLNYNEPPDWPLPVRPYLGAALLDAGRAKEAVAVYEEDLKRFPENGWSLHGLAQAQKKLKQKDAAADSERRQAAAWQWADVKLVASRF
ncbi:MULTISPECIES: hypothetical protein [unclassified Lysobacter]|uniref:tetratricopeptide repeat protein n=1 Tax=unclassified Lysobacter TaxID=2635362 RepID=UPI001C239CF9|nr:hypothetical protein [Lysobacter sp. MMG2]MBU8977466.1 hypothetical protein [Lysobacter sp. MMG2]